VSDALDLEPVKEELKRGDIKLETVKDAVKKYKDMGFELLKLLEYASKIAKGDERKEIERLYKEFAHKSSSDLCESLRRKARRLREISEDGVCQRFFKDNAPTGTTFRLLELTRMGRRDEVFHLILREFLSSGEEVPYELMKAFDPIFPIEIFKVFVYSFVGGLSKPAEKPTASGQGGDQDEQSE
jgi:hypothetical protein